MTPTPHTPKPTRLWPAAALSMALLIGMAHAQAPAQPTAPVAVGQPLPALDLKDQHDQPWTIPTHTRLVLLASGRKAANLVQAVLEKEPPGFLLQHHAVYLADLSKMPGFATRMFALPALRDMPFKVGVSLTEATLATWPRAPGAVTLIELQQGTVQRVSHATTETALRSALNP